MLQRAAIQARVRPIIGRGAAVAALILLGGCASGIDGAVRPPHDWVATAPTGTCQHLSGTYAARGEPAPANSSAWLYAVLWPVTGSLVSIATSGVNGEAGDDVPAVHIDVDRGGAAVFSVQTADGQWRALETTEWWCADGKLTTRAALVANPESFDRRQFEESHVRMWRSANGALIAENTIRTIRQGSFGAMADRRPLARFYFRFPAVVPKAAARTGSD